MKCYDLKTKIYTGFENIYHDTNLLSAEHILSFYMDSEGVLWIAGCEVVGSPGGLTLFDTKTGNTKVFVHNDSDSHSISNNILNGFYDDGNGTVWISTDGGGLNRFNKNTKQFLAYTIKDGLPDNSISNILADGKGNLWLSSDKGICKFTPPV